ncbi:Gfo/Idh/MocA family protein [Falsirhodobacter algicola]|uniref:Gfo/Idh/MocA family oxidoreductase n=1 Tax=Falsirhodobacter algicola TaxID=2692330 RepID=A0A8J8MS32_9RHOB|nr:Gfo/Idh/MocA family oxidoreductase [Falsirhodobacter algicola]QUS35671.1 Gfo/Idh/MocA family oxidoreductase [Falsirhodobacter algicola]
MTTIRYGVIGCGMMGQEHLRNIALLPEAEVVAVYEPDEGMRAEAARFVPEATMVASVADLLAIEAVNCLLIASPNHMHLQQLEEIARIRPLPVLVEKPLFVDPADAPRLAELRAAYPAPIWVAMEYRYMPPVAHLIREAEAATGGVRMLTIREHRFPFLAKVNNWNRFNATSGGTLVEKCCHFFDLMRLIAGCNPVRVMASSGQAVNHLDETYNGETPDIWDNAYVIVEFESGLRAMLELCMFAEGSRYQEEISAVGPRGKIECLVPGPGRFWPSDLGEPPVPQVIVSPRHPKGPRMLDVPVDPELLEAGDHNGSTFYQHQGFVRAAQGRQDPEVSLSDGWWAVTMGMAAQESARTGKAVEIASVAHAPR